MHSARVYGRELYVLSLIPPLRAAAWLAGGHRGALDALIRFSNLLVHPVSGDVRAVRENSRDLETYWRTHDGQDFDLYAAALGEPRWYEGRRILDFGCGVGRKSYEMARGGAAEVLGIDASARNIEVAKRMAGNVENLRFLVTMAEDLGPEHSGRFDDVVSFTVFEHVSDVPGALTQVFRLLRPGGRAVIVYQHYDDRNGSHLKEFVQHPWPQLIFPEEALFDFWNRRLAEAQARGEMHYFPPGYRHGFSEHNQDCFMNLNRHTVEDFEAMVPGSGLVLEREFFYSRSPLLARLPFLARSPLASNLRGSAVYVLRRPA
jgi:SAM-dependent methyltransferase